MFVGKATRVERLFTLVGSVLTHKIGLDWKGLSGTKTLRILTNYRRKKFYNTGPGLFGADVCRKNARRRNFGKNRFFLKKYCQASYD